MITVSGLALAVACGGGGGGGNGGNPSGPSGGGGSVTSGATITIGANGNVSPTSVTINAGQGVTFINNSTRTRNVSSDPHPAHTECPQVNTINLINAGQSKVTSAFPTARTCGFHDHDDPDDAGLKGSIVIR